MNKNKKLFLSFIFLFSFLVIPHFVQAGFLDSLNTPKCIKFDDKGQCLEVQTCIDDGLCSLDDVAQGFIALTQFLIGAIGALALLYFIWGGIKWLTSYGNQQKIQQGREIMLQTVIALIIAFMSYILVSFFVNNFLQAKICVQVNSNGECTQYKAAVETKTVYPDEPSQNIQVATHCCVSNEANQVDCKVIPVQSTCPAGYDENGPGNCSNVVMCDANWHAQSGCCVEAVNNNIVGCEDLGAGDICEFDFYTGIDCAEIPGNVCG